MTPNRVFCSWWRRYNFRGFDIGNHFCEYSGYVPDYDKTYPSKERQLHFLRAYVQALGDVDLGERVTLSLSVLACDDRV